MSASTETPMSLDDYKQASRDELELVVEKFARIEQAADLQAGSLVEGLLEYLANETAEEVIGYIESAYELTTTPPNWEKRVEAVIEEMEAA